MRTISSPFRSSFGLSIGLWCFVSCAPGCDTGGLNVFGGGSDGGASDLAHSLSDLSVAPDLAIIGSGIGAPCTGAGGMDQGSCNAGQYCLPDGTFGSYVGGYCTAACGMGNPACPPDSACIQRKSGVYRCYLKCAMDGDCRTPDYSCQQINAMDPTVCSPVANMGGGSNNNTGVTPGTRDGGACVTPVLEPQGQGPFGANVQLTGSAKSIESEVQLTVDPKNQNIIVGYNDLSGTGGMGAIHSGNDGVSWGNAFHLPVDKTINKNQEESDPVTAIDGLGNVYMSFVGFDRSIQSPNPSNMHIWLARSTNGGITFADMFQVSPNNEWASGGFLDKPWLYANPADNALYMTWDRQATASAGVDIRMARSTDSGKTWSAPVALNDLNARPNADRNLAQIAIGANGLPVVAWVEIGQQQFGSTSNGIYLQRLNANGSPNGKNVKVSAGADSPAFMDPSVAVSGNNVYVGFISGNPEGVWDVLVASSLDGGASFQPSVKVNDDPSCATHFLHQIVTDAKGNVHAIWYDNRYLKGNVFYAESGPADKNNALLFGKNQFVNDVSFTFTARRDMSNWLGDYLGLTVVGSELYAAWSDNRINNFSHIFFAKAKLP